MVSAIASPLLASLLAAVSPADPSTAGPEVVVPSGPAPRPTHDDRPEPSLLPPSGPHRPLFMPHFALQLLSLGRPIIFGAGDPGGGEWLGGSIARPVKRWLSLRAGIVVDFDSESSDAEGYRGPLRGSPVTVGPLPHSVSDAGQISVGPKPGLGWSSESSGSGNRTGHLDWHGSTHDADPGVLVRLFPAIPVVGIAAIDFMLRSSRTCNGCGNWNVWARYPPSHNVQSAILALRF